MCTKAFLYKSVQSVCSKMFTDFVPSQINMNTIECFTESSYMYHIYIKCICLVFINPYVPSVMFPIQLQTDRTGLTPIQPTQNVHVYMGTYIECYNTLNGTQEF